MIIDFHTHIFPDTVAPNAIPFLEKQGDVKANLDGTKDSLLLSMEQAGIAKSVVCLIATKPSQFESIFKWSKEIASDQIIPFPSVHPADPDCLAQIEQIKKAGFSGIKMHPFYQDFIMDEKRLEPIYETLVEQQLIVLMHTGYDIAFPRHRLADPAKIIKVINQFPKLKMVTSHLGGWDIWDEVSQILIGKPIYMDLSFALESLEVHQAKEMITQHPAEYVLFGSDSPWAAQADVIELVKKLQLNPELEEKILGKNAHRLLNSV